jgi:hypothetical protein
MARGRPVGALGDAGGGQVLDSGLAGVVGVDDLTEEQGEGDQGRGDAIDADAEFLGNDAGDLLDRQQGGEGEVFTDEEPAEELARERAGVRMVHRRPPCPGGGWLVTTPSRPGEADVSYPLPVRRVPADSVPLPRGQYR